MNTDKPYPESIKSWFAKFLTFIKKKPKDRNQLIDVLREATERQLLDANSLGMIEGVLEMAKLRVRDIMIPRSQMVIIEKNMSLEEIVSLIIKTVHSRFPVIGDNKDEILGVLLAKDLLNYSFNQTTIPFSIQTVIRTPFFVPESKRLDVLLQEFRSNRNHMAVVVDEYGGITGLVTIEDILEEIVGEIEDEYDIDNDQLIKKFKSNAYSVNALTPIEEFNDFFKTKLSARDVETIGGLILQQFGHLPKRGETLEMDNFVFKILRADKRRIILLQVTLKN
ncbi:MAG: magnesium/cobalt efflux protein [Francisellaceae bacterium]|nr:magnesium/cobalt efflux protein [Francisellaceae bacterium]